MSIGLQTEFEFELPKGYIDSEGNRHRQGTMRLATAADEILPLKDSRVQSNPNYLVIIVLSRVLTQLGTLSADDINPKIIEGIFASDLTYLQDLYNRINGNGAMTVKAICPKCDHAFEVGVNTLGEG